MAQHHELYGGCTSSSDIEGFELLCQCPPLISETFVLKTMGYVCSLASRAYLVACSVTHRYVFMASHFHVIVSHIHAAFSSKQKGGHC